MGNLSFGTDPEFMVVDESGAYRSAIGIVRGTKEHKLDLGGGHFAFYDNVLLEMNVVAGYEEQDVVDNLRDAMSRAASVIYPHRMVCQASQVYPVGECQHEDAQVFGCDPEYCAYDMAQLNPPTCEPGNTFRSAGGHIHLGYEDEAFPLLAPVEDGDRHQRDWGRVWVVRMLDLFVGLPALVMDHDPTSAARRGLYGKAGSHRPKEEYGVEYRATSNFWLQSPSLTRVVYRLAAYAVESVANGLHRELWSDEGTCTAYNVDELRRTIDGGDVANAKRMLESLVRPLLPKSLYLSVFDLSEPTQYDLYREWHLTF